MITTNQRKTGVPAWSALLFAVLFCYGTSSLQAQLDNILLDYETPVGFVKNYNPANAVENCGSFSFATIGTTESEEQGQQILPLPDGGFLFAAIQNGATVLIKYDESLNTEWQNILDLSPNDDFISNLILDSDGMALGVGYSSTASGSRDAFCFKYDLSTEDLVWAIELTQTQSNAVPSFFNLMEKGPGGNYLLFGQTSPNSGDGLGCDATLIEVERQTGAQVWAKNYNLGSCETFVDMVFHDNAIYATGRYNFDGGGVIRMRPGLTKLDLDGNQEWSKLHLVNINSAARLYSTSIIVDDNSLVIYAHGDLNGGDDDTNTSFLYKVSTEGNMLWAREFSLDVGSTLRAKQVVSTSSGYLALGTYELGNSTQSYALETNKNGLLLSTVQYGTIGSTSVTDLRVIDDEFLLVGSTDQHDLGNTDAFIARLNQEGTIDGACDFTSSLLVFEEPIDAYDEFHPLIEYTSPYQMSAITSEQVTAIIETNIACGAEPCPSCTGEISTFTEEATVCDPVTFAFVGECEINSYFWAFCDPSDATSCAGIDVPSSTSANPIVQFSNAGLYVIQLTINEGLDNELVVFDTLAVADADCCEGIIIECPQDITILCGDSIDPADLGAPIVVDSCGPVIIESEDFFDPSCGISGTLIRSFMITDESASSLTCTQFITIVPDCANFTVDLGPDQDLCAGAIVLSANHTDPVCSETGEEVTYLWSTGDTTQNILVDEIGSYSVEVMYCDQCIATDTVEITECIEVDCPEDLFNGGTIAVGECVAGVVIIESVLDPEYEGLDLEAVWLQSSNGDDCYDAVFELVPFNVGELYNEFIDNGGFGLADPTIPGTSWMFVTDNDGDDLQLTIEALAQASCFMRCTRVIGCERFFGEANLVSVEPCLAPLIEYVDEKDLGGQFFHPGQIVVFPNPARELVHFDAALFIDQQVQVEIYNNLGQIVYNQSIQAAANRIIINSALFNNGFYIARFTINAEERITKQFIISK